MRLCRPCCRAIRQCGLPDRRGPIWVERSEIGEWSHFEAAAWSPRCNMRELFPPLSRLQALRIIDADAGVPSGTVEDACIPCLEAGYKLYFLKIWRDAMTLPAQEGNAPTEDGARPRSVRQGQVATFSQIPVCADLSIAATMRRLARPKAKAGKHPSPAIPAARSCTSITLTSK